MNADIESWLKNLYSKIDSVDKKTFIFFFALLNFIFFYNTVFFLFGNHDWHIVLDRVNIQESLGLGRYAATWFDYYLSYNFHLPLIANQVCFIFISLYTILTLHYWNVKKTFFNYVISGIFIVTVPYIYAYFYYKFLTISFLGAFLSVIIALSLCEKAISQKNKLLKLTLYLFSYIILCVFVLGAYQPSFNLILILLLSKIIIEYIDNNFNNLINIIKDRISTFFIFILSCITSAVSTKLIIHHFGYSYSYNTSMISIRDIPSSFLNYLEVLKNTLFYDKFPYIFYKFKILMFIICIFAVIVLLKNIFINKKFNLFNKIQKSVTVIFLLTILFFISKILYLISSFLSTYGEYRLEYFTVGFIYFLSIIICLKYGSNLIRNCTIILLIIISHYCIVQDIDIQKNLLMSRKIELSLQENLFYKIINNPNFNPEKEYKYIQIGSYASINQKIYNTYLSVAETGENELTKCNLVSFQQDIIISYIGKILNVLHIIPEDIPTYNYETIKDYINNDIKNFLLNDAQVYPVHDSIYIDNNDNIIIVVMDKDELDNIRNNLRK